jgi:hypothetical protein
MDLVPALRNIADRNCGIFTRQDAVACGYTERQLKTLTGHGGRWLVLRRGVYVDRAYVERLGPDTRHLLAVRAVNLTAQRPAVVSHTDAAALHGFPTRPWWLELHHLTRPGVLGSRTEAGVKHHRALLRDQDVVVVAGLRTTSLARTGVDVAREHGFEDGVIACDAALRLGATLDELVEQVELGRHWPHNAGARAALKVADGGAESIGETLMRLLVYELEIGRPETQFAITVDGRTAYADLRVGRHLFEFDGRVKYVERDQGGVADGPVNEVVWREKQREDWMRRAHGGFGMSRVVWHELFGRARATTKRRLRQEYLDTERRFGRWAA